MNARRRPNLGFSLFALSGCALAAAALGSLAACTPPQEGGQCIEDSDCTGRGQVCQTTTNVCEDREQDYSSTQEPTPETNFTGKAIPFFRGRVCSAPNQQILAGSSIPLLFQPCYHPCITPTSYKIQHDWRCDAATCQARSVYWVIADGNDCPAEAWGEFDPAMCSYSMNQESQLGTIELDGMPLEALVQYEIPFFTNIDIANINNYSSLERDGLIAGASDACLETCDGSAVYENCLKNCYNRELAFQYVQQDNRTITFDLANSHPSPPANCTDDPSACECVEIGF